MKATRFRTIGVGLTVFAVLWLLVTLYPLFFTLLSSFKNNTEIFTSPMALPAQLRVENYVRALQNVRIARNIVNSLFLAAVSVVTLLFLVSLCAFVLARIQRRWTSIVALIILSGFLLPVHSALIPLTRLVASLGGFNSYLMLIVLFVAYNAPLSIFLVTGYVKGIPKELDAAAFIDGCGYFRYVVHVIIPVSKPILATAGIVAFLFIYNDLIFSMLFLSRPNLYTVSMGLNAFFAERSVAYGPVFASIVLTSAPIIAIYLLFQEQVQRGVTGGAVKG